MLLIQVIHAAQAVLILVIVPLLLVACGVAVAKRKRRRAAAFGIGGVIALGLYTCCGVESYCYVYPSIDTRYASGFSESKFAEVRAGMSMNEVITLLGEPYHRGGGRNSVRWSYTQDGKCFWADWAWLGREIVFMDVLVVERLSRVYYD
jgi:outer membrane protein assembly factor BamE (lipoprotein component of BamABCDE complex)